MAAYYNCKFKCNQELITKLKTSTRRPTSRSWLLYTNHEPDYSYACLTTVIGRDKVLSVVSPLVKGATRLTHTSSYLYVQLFNRNFVTFRFFFVVRFGGSPRHFFHLSYLYTSKWAYERKSFIEVYCWRTDNAINYRKADVLQASLSLKSSRAIHVSLISPSQRYVPNDNL